MSALFCLFLCSRSYPEKLEVYIPKFYKIRYILHELYVAVIRIISQLIICIDQLNITFYYQIQPPDGTLVLKETVLTQYAHIWVGLASGEASANA